MSNEGISEIFLEIADLLDLEGVAFKPESYRRAARALQQLPEDVAEKVRDGTVGTIPGVGEALSEKIREYVETGKVPYLEKLQKQWPPGLLQLMRLEGIGPKTTRRFFLEFQVKGPEDLDRILQEGKLQGVRGFGDRKVELLKRAVAKALVPGGGEAEERRLPLPEAQALADELLEALRASGAPLDRLVFAGSLRRRRETVGDLDFLATSTRPREVMDRFVHLESVAEVRLSGDTKSTVILRGGFQVDLRVVAAEAFGAALQYFTGSKDHNVHLRSLANQKGFKINEYGMTRDGTLVPAPAEEEVYAAVGLPWVPPELRENTGEIEAALADRLPTLIEPSSLRGELHIHVPASVGSEDLEPWLEALRHRKMRYGGFVVRAQDLAAAGKDVQSLRRALPTEKDGVAVHLGVEMVLERSGSLPAPPRGADFLVVRPPEGGMVPSTGTWLKGGVVPVILGHVDPTSLPSGSTLWKAWRASGSKSHALDVEVSSESVLLPSPRVREAREAGIPLVLSGLPRIPEELSRVDLAVGIARRAWATPSSIVNAMDEFGSAAAASLPDSGSVPARASHP